MSSVGRLFETGAGATHVGVGVGVAVGVGVVVGVNVGVGVAVGVTVGVGVGVGVAVGVTVGVGVGVGVAVGVVVADGVAVGVTEGVGVGVTDRGVARSIAAALAGLTAPVKARIDTRTPASPTVTPGRILRLVTTAPTVYAVRPEIDRQLTKEMHEPCKPGVPCESRSIPHRQDRRMLTRCKLGAAIRTAAAWEWL